MSGKTIEQLWLQYCAKEGIDPFLGDTLKLPFVQGCQSVIDKMISECVVLTNDEFMKDLCNCYVEAINIIDNQKTKLN